MEKIPKIIHYVWMGKTEKNKHILKCMKSWKKLKGYKIIEWNEDNFDINSNLYVKKAYENKKWAFVSDYVRFYAIYTYGGIYFDTDVVVSKNIDSLLENDAFVGFEDDNYPFTAVFGATAHHKLAKEVLDYYNNLNENNISFDPKDNNTISVSNILINKYKCKLGNLEQNLSDGIHVYPSQILCKPSLKSKTIHAFTATWNDKLRDGLKYKIRMFLMVRTTNKIGIIIYLLFKNISDLLKI